jgi:hypothetical protein
VLTETGKVYVETAKFILISAAVQKPMDTEAIRSYVEDYGRDLDEVSRDAIVLNLSQEAEAPEVLQASLLNEGWLKEKIF